MPPDLPITTRRWGAALAVACLAIALGLMLRWESARHQITGAASTCRISKVWDCDRVQDSRYSKYLGVSLSVWGVAGYLILASWLVAARRQGPTLLAGAGLLSAFCLVVSGFMAYLSYSAVGAFCLYCTGMQICALLLALLLIPPAARATRTGLRRNGVAFAALSAVLLVGFASAGEAYASRRTDLARLYGGVEGQAVRIDLSDALILGDPSTPHAVLVFFDFGCPYCKRCYNKATRILKRYPDQVHFIFKHFPLDRTCNSENVDATVHPGSCKAAAAAQAAAGMGRTAEGMRFIFEHQADGYSPLVLDGLGKLLGIDRDAWRKLSQGQAAKDIVARDTREGGALHLEFVPVAYLDGRPIDPQRMAQRVERAIEAAGTPR